MACICQSEQVNLAVQFLRSVIEARHEVAHGAGPGNTAFADLRAAFRYLGNRGKFEFFGPALHKLSVLDQLLD